MARKASLINTKVVPSVTNPTVAISSSSSADIIVDTLIVTNVDWSSHNYEILVAEVWGSGSTAVAIISSNAIAAHTAEIANVAWVPFDVSLTWGQSLYVKSDSPNNLVFRVMGKRFSAGSLTE